MHRCFCVRHSTNTAVVAEGGSQPSQEEMDTQVKELFTIGLTERKPEYLDTLVACWVSGGLFDALEESIDLLLTIWDAGFKLTMVLQVMSSAIPKLTRGMQTLLRLQFPRRPLLVSKVAPEQMSSRFRQASHEELHGSSGWHRKSRYRQSSVARGCTQDTCGHLQQCSATR
ncbi:hypothetical protein K466DRAFT_149915 [Polyporus arcularius HHB13444]|uniref:Uncharacterized protein n=1 Tax=Polyporus arcularius HHB13444 TaxID=1314778 RepID=A0A5C3P9Y1_9APHY|nr:hypothetical protein K466DRAFT_149915 [Polyporus arcularius HHB13444]